MGGPSTAAATAATVREAGADAGAAVAGVLAPGPDPAAWVLVLGAVLAAALVLHPRLWRSAGHVSTIVHEGSHGLAALATGRQLRGIRLHSDASGVAVSRGRPTGPGMVATAAAGYPGPALVGLGAAAVLATGRWSLVLWGVLLALALLLARVRNWFGLWSVLATGGVVAVVVAVGPPAAQQLLAQVIAWFLPLAGLRDVRGLAAARRAGARGTDADQLARLTGVPAPAWVAAFGLVSAGSLAVVARTALAPLLGG